jgi:hypothetical protein
MSKTKYYPASPECDKLKAAAPRSQQIGEFLEWLQSNEVLLCRFDARMGKEGEYWPINQRIENLLAEFFEIDLAKVEKERRAILEWLQHEQKV